MIESVLNSMSSISILVSSLHRVVVFKIDVTAIVWHTSPPITHEFLLGFPAGVEGSELSGEEEDSLSSVLLISANLTCFSGVLVLEVGSVP